MQATQSGASEVAIFSRILDADPSSFSTAAAQAMLELRFADGDQERMRILSSQAKEGTLTSEEQTEINNYEKVGHILSLIKSKARRSLKRDRETSGQTAH